MKVLFFVEAFPLRNRLTGHLWLVGEIRRLVARKEGDKSAEPDLRIFCGELAQERLLRDDATAMQSVIPFSSTLDDLFMSRANTWRHTAPEDASVGGIDGWLNYVNGEDAQMSEQIYRELKAIKATQFDFDAIVYWGANDIFSNSRLARHLPGVVSVAMEFGPTRLPFEPTLAIDSHGVNGKACGRN